MGKTPQVILVKATCFFVVKLKIPLLEPPGSKRCTLQVDTDNGIFYKHLLPLLSLFKGFASYKAQNFKCSTPYKIYLFLCYFRNDRVALTWCFNRNLIYNVLIMVRDSS